LSSGMGCVCGLVFFPCLVCRGVEGFLDVGELGVAIGLEVC
jgi:hypothetical protein